MNFKFLFPTFLNRFTFVERSLKSYDHNATGVILNIGTGEGDYDPMIAKYCTHLIGCDHNDADLNFAKSRNKDTGNIRYVKEDALDLSFEDNSFDRVIAVEVVEHVHDPLRMLSNIYRVLKPGGLAILTFPSGDFPITYDPINRVMSWFTERHLPIGAFAFGHTNLITSEEFRKWGDVCGFAVLEEVPLSGYLVGLLEIYWTGLVQRIFKFNALNKSKHNNLKFLASRPGNKIPKLAILAKKITDIDARFFIIPKHSIGKGFVIQKKTISQ
jgi:ubiquinone/menaquinone biosynthesis C-methylase UbiE